MEEKVQVVLAQWQTCVEMANNISQRRDSMNNLMVTLNLALITAISIVWDLKSIIMCCAGMVASLVWILFINYFKRINKAKYDVIIYLESKLPEKPFYEEWEMLKEDKKHRDGTCLEKALPIVFTTIYIILAAMLFSMKEVQV